MRIRSALPFAAAAALAAPVGLAGPALASSGGRSSVVKTKSTTFAGYHALHAASSMTVSTKVVVPSLKCTKASRAIAPGASFLTVSSASAAELFVGCSKGKAQFYPSLVINGTRHNYPSLHAHPGDAVALTVSENASGTTASVVDSTHKSVKKTVKGSGTMQPLTDPMIGDFPWFKSSSSMKPEGVPDFGKLGFSASMINGATVGSYSSGTLFQVSRYNSTLTTLQIAAGKLAGDNASFKTVFKHS